MSIVVGKRNYTENFSNLLPNDFHKDGFYRKKMVLQENSSYNRNYQMNFAPQEYRENLRALKHNFPQTDDAELVTVLEDCDNNLEIAMEILQKSIQVHLIAEVQPIQDRSIKEIQNIKGSQRRDATYKEEKKHDNSIQEEDPTAHIKMQEARYFAGKLMERLNTVRIEDAKDFLTNVLFDFKNEVEKKEQPNIAKLQYDKSLLIDACINRKKKVDELEKTNQDNATNLERKAGEIRRLRAIIKQNELRIGQIDIQKDKDDHDHQFNHDIY